MEAAIYLTISIAGYISLGKTLTPKVFTLRPPIRKTQAPPPNLLKPAGTNDVLMYSIQWIFVIVILLHVPINLFTARNMLFTFFEVERTDRNWNIITVVMTYLIFGIPILYPDIIGFLGIFGGIFCCSDDLIVPFLIGYTLRSKPSLPLIFNL